MQRRANSSELNELVIFERANLIVSRVLYTSIWQRVFQLKLTIYCVKISALFTEEKVLSTLLYIIVVVVVGFVNEVINLKYSVFI